MKENSPKISLATEQQINTDVIDAWHRAEKGLIDSPETTCYFLESSTFFKVLSPDKVALLQQLHQLGETSIRKLSQVLGRDYKYVQKDVTLLIKAGLIVESSDKRISVPFDKINTEISLLTP